VLGYSFKDIERVGGNIPGFQTLKDRLIKPLIFATEKVVEYYMQDDQIAGENLCLDSLKWESFRRERIGEKRTF
jgi:hypothetical protein